jgi:hypothetical protein
MVARILPAIGLRVAFERDGREQESETAPTGAAAVKMALLMIVRQDFLQAGDRLTVTET